MFAAVLGRLRRARDQQLTPMYTVETAKLTRAQIGLGVRILSRCGLTRRLEKLSKQDMLNFLYGVGMNPTPDMIDGKLRGLKLHRKDVFSWGDLAHLWAALLEDYYDEEEVIWRAFQYFDKDGNGDISVSELEATMRELGGYLSQEELELFVQLMDTDKDGVISYDEFLDVLHSQVPSETISQAGTPRSRRTTLVGQHLEAVRRSTQSGVMGRSNTLGRTQSSRLQHLETPPASLALPPATGASPRGPVARSPSSKLFGGSALSSPTLATAAGATSMTRRPHSPSSPHPRSRSTTSFLQPATAQQAPGHSSPHQQHPHDQAAVQASAAQPPPPPLAGTAAADALEELAAASAMLPSEGHTTAAARQAGGLRSLTHTPQPPPSTRPAGMPQRPRSAHTTEREPQGPED